MEYTREYEWLRLREKFIKVDGVRNWKWKMWIGKKGEKTNEVRYKLSFFEVNMSDNE